MTEPISTGAAGGTAIIKIFGIPLVASAMASTMGFLILWPRTMREAVIRVMSTLIFSIVLGPLLVFALHSWYPDLFASARAVAVLAGMPSEFGLVAIAGPIMAIAGLPAWWVLGAVILWFDKRRGKDIGELYEDAKHTIEG